MTIALGVLFGIAGAAWHLVVARGRARAFIAGRGRLAWVLLPAGLVGPLLAFAGSVAIGDMAPLGALGGGIAGTWLGLLAVVTRPAGGRG